MTRGRGISATLERASSELIKDADARERFEMRVRSELAYALHIHASRVLLLAVKTPADGHRDNLVCINIAAHKEDVRSKQELASTLAPALGTHACLIHSRIPSADSWPHGKRPGSLTPPPPAACAGPQADKSRPAVRSRSANTMVILKRVSAFRVHDAWTAGRHLRLLSCSGSLAGAEGFLLAPPCLAPHHKSLDLSTSCAT